MAVTIGRKLIEKYVLKKLAERSGKRTGITTIQNVKDPQVQFNIEEVRKTIESLGMSPNDVKSVAEIEKIMNIRKAVSDQTIKNKFKNLGLDKGVDDLAKKPPFQGFTPTIVGKPAKGNINYPEIEKKFGFPLRGNESLSELAKIERIGRDSYYDMLANRAMNIRRRMSKVDAEGGTEIGYQEFNKLQEELDGLNDFITRVQKEIPEDMASGGLARVGMVVGGSVWKKFIEQLFMKSSNNIRQGKGLFKGLNQEQMITQHDNLTKMLKKWEMSGKKGLPEGASQYLGVNDLQVSKAIKDAEKQVLSKPKKTLEGLEREGTIDISNPEVADEFSTFIKQSDPEGYKDLEQKIQLEDFDVTGRKKNASGGIAGQLHLNQGGRARFQTGGDATRPNVEGGSIVYDLGNGYKVYKSSEGFEIVDPQGVYTSLGSNTYSDGSPRTLEHLFEDGVIMRRAGDTTASTPVAGEALGTDLEGIGMTEVAGDKGLYDILNEAASLDKIAALEASYNQGKDLPTATGIISDARHQTSLSQLRDTIAKNLAFNPDKPGAISKTVGGIGALGAGVINELGQLVTKPSEAIEDLKSNWQGVTKTPYGQTPEQTYSSVTANYQPQQTTEQIARASQYGDSRMQAAADKGMDARMGRTYAENIQAMADPRMLQAKGGLANILGV